MDQGLKYQVHTFGCKVNTYDTGLIQKNLSKNGFTQNSEKIDNLSSTQVHVLNTCSVTGEATKQAVKLIRRIKSKQPLSTVVVTGCAAQVDTEQFRQLPGADIIVANSHKGLLPQIIDDFYKGKITDKVFKSNIFRKEDLESGGGLEASHSRSFLKIQDGCNSFCTYCIIPYARGKSRSIPMKELLKRIQEIAELGVREIVLTGVHIGDYEDDGKNLEDLVEYLLNKTSNIRYRLTSLEPVELTERLLNLYKDSRLCPHFHMSIQSAETNTLKAMKRNYDSDQVVSSLNRIQEQLPHAFIGMDVIVGFPTETDEEFNKTFESLKQSPWTKLHVFPYSERSGTRAAVMTQTVPQHVRVERAKRLRELSLDRIKAIGTQQIGSIKNVLILKNAKGYHGLSEDYWPVKIIGADDFAQHWVNEFIQVQVTEIIFNPQSSNEVILQAEVFHAST